MITHRVVVGAIDVSEDVVSIRVDAALDTESDPSKVEIRLANIKRMYDMAFTPQTTQFQIELINERRKAPTDGDEIPYNFDDMAGPDVYTASISDSYKHVDYYDAGRGYVSDVKCNQDYAIISGVCIIGPLASSVNEDVSTVPQAMPVDTVDIMERVAANSTTQFSYGIKASLAYWEQYQKASENSIQEMLNDAAHYAHAVVYADELGVVQIRDPKAIRGSKLNMNGYITNADITSSIMGYCNIVMVVGDRSERLPSKEGHTTPSHINIYYEARDEESIEKYGELRAPTIFDPKFKIKEGSANSCEEFAEKMLRYYKTFLNALTKPKVIGMAPLLQQHVVHKIPIPPDFTATSVSEGVVTRKVIDYSGDGWEADLEISPGILGMEDIELTSLFVVPDEEE